MAYPPPAFLRGINDLLAGRVSVGLFYWGGAWAPGLPNYAEMFTVKGLRVAPIPAEAINSGGLEQYSALCVPGGWAPGYMELLTEAGYQNIRAFVEAGGSYFGVCAGSWLVSDQIDWRGTRYDYPVDLFPGVSHDTDAIAVYPDMKMTRVEVDLTGILPGIPFARHYEMALQWGGPWFETPEGFEHMVLGRFTEGVLEGKPAAIAFQRGKGKVVLFSPHPETSKNYLWVWPIIDWLLA